MTDTKKYLNIEGLTEYHESAGHSADIADGSITTAKLAPMAVTASKIADKSITSTKLARKAVDSYSLADDAVTFGKIDDSAVRAMHNISLIAADAQTDQALTALGFEHNTFTPEQMLVYNRYADISYRLCWISGTNMEAAPISFYGNLQTRAITLYAKGNDSMATGVLGADTSWTITALNS